MSGKFMKVKRIVIPTITMIIIASQLLGCAAVDQNEMLAMINNGDAIEIEVASPAFAEEQQGEESSLLWEQLALLTTNPELRKDLDNTLGITVTDTGKNGILYVNADGKNEPNNTLHVALHNREFAKLFEDENSMLEIANTALNNYTDIEADETEKAVNMAINGYFNLLPDATPKFSNPDTTITRAEFMAMVMRATTPVSDITADSNFSTAVGQNDLNLYAQEVADHSYLDLESKSLNNMTYNGTITRAEALYMLADMFYEGDFDTVDLSKFTFADAKDGGNIAEEQKFIEDATSKDYWKSYELTYAITNPDSGLPTSLYKGLAISFDKKILTSDETRWDEALTKSEAVEFIINALKSDPSIPTFNAKQGTVDVVSNKEPEIPLGTASSEAEKSNEDTVNLEILEDQQFRNETAQKMVEQAKEYYEQGLITKEEYDGIIEGAKTLEEGIQWNLPEDLTTPHIDVDVPGWEPHDPSKDGDYHLGEGGEAPADLQGRFIN